jgi:hypothetical protein
MTSRFRLTSRISTADKTDKALKDYYKSWREQNKQSKSGFMALDNSFRDTHLSSLEPGPLRLYLYFSFAASNDYGFSWHGITKIAEFFETQTRTIDNWIKVLVDKDLIYREQKGNKSHTTYLIPFSNTVITHPAQRKREDDSQEVLDDLIKTIEELEFLYGDIIKVFHLFQWTSRKGKPVTRDNSTQLLLIISKRTNGVLIGHIHVLRKSNQLSVNQLFTEEPSIFNSPFHFEGSNLIGLVLPPTPPLQTRASLKDTLDLIEELAELEDWIIKDRPELEYGNKDELLPVVDEEDTEIEDAEDIGETNEDAATVDE